MINNHFLSNKNRHADAGFTLVEVLVAVVVLAIGLLGLAGLQATGLRSSSSAYMFSQASFLANDIADRMRANRPGVAAGNYDAVTANPGGAKCFTAGCANSAAVATADLTEWYESLASLPGGTGSVTGAGAGSVFTVIVMWDDERTGAAGTGCSGNSAVDLTCYRLQVQL